MERGEGGAIVNVSSQASQAALKDHLVYCKSVCLCIAYCTMYLQSHLCMIAYHVCDELVYKAKQKHICMSKAVSEQKNTEMPRTGHVLTKNHIMVLELSSYTSLRIPCRIVVAMEGKHPNNRHHTIFHHLVAREYTTQG